MSTVGDVECGPEEYAPFVVTKKSSQSPIVFQRVAKELEIPSFVMMETFKRNQHSPFGYLKQKKSIKKHLQYRDPFFSFFSFFF